MSGVILGIDLGTTNTVVAAARDGNSLVLADGQGRTTQPSMVSFHPSGQVLTGCAARQRRAIDPRNTLFSIKRLIGRGAQARETKEMQKRMPFEIVCDERHDPILRTRAGDFAPAEISALVLDHAKTLAETALGHEVTEAVIAVPASFTEAQRSATCAAGSIAGLTILQVINEPTAAAVAFGYQKHLDEIVAVYDLGGGTFDISVLRVKGDSFEVLSSAGDAFLGGDDIDERIVRRMVSECLRRHQVDLRDDATAMQRLHGVAEQLKIDLGQRPRSRVKVDEIAYVAGGKALDLEMALTRSELDEMAGELIRQTFPVCQEALQQAGLAANAISALVLVGGATRMPLVHEMVAGYFGREPRTDVQPEEAVAIGAALHGASITAREITRSSAQSVAGPIVFEVTPQALGVATVAGFCEHIIKRNSPIPGQAVQVFATSRDDQRTIRLRVCQGNARTFSDNTELGDLVFDTLAPGPRGTTRIEVTFDLDASSRLQVTARDPDTGSQQRATLDVIGAHSTGPQSAASQRLRTLRK